MKRMHPATKLILAAGRAEYQEAAVLRHVKPLLDALEEWHTSQVRYEQVLGLKKHLCHGDTCRLLTVWRAKL